MGEASPLELLAATKGGPVKRTKSIDGMSEDVRGLIVAARRNGWSGDKIAEALTDSGHPITASPVISWLKAQGEW